MNTPDHLDIILVMPEHSEKRSLLIILSVFSFVFLGTYVVTLFARGYRPGFQPQNGLTLSATGLLSVTSRPKSASVYIDDRLITATDDTVNLSPKEYLVKIVKDGYIPWQKTARIKKEIVFQTDAQLFRSAPDLNPVTLSGALNPVISPDKSKVIYSVASASATLDNGLYLIELASSPLVLTKNTPRQIAKNFPGIDWSKAKFVFSPNSRQILVNFGHPSPNYLLNLDIAINQSTLLDITARLPIIKNEWQIQEQELTQIRLNRLPVDLQPLVSTESANLIAFSPGDDKVLYLANQSGQIPENLITPPPAQSTQSQARSIVKDNYYVYDLKDDTNFLIGSRNTVLNPFWLPNSTNLIYIDNQSIKAVDYDATNKVTVFTGIFSPDNVFPWADGTKIITLTAAYQGAAENLYAVTIR
jgi:hypothetical protein